MARSQLTSELIAAAKEGNQERCQQLLSQGADVNGANEQVSRNYEQIGGNVQIAHMIVFVLSIAFLFVISIEKQLSSHCVYVHELICEQMYF